MNINEIEIAIADMQNAFNEIQMPRTPFVLQHFVVGAQGTEPQQYHQCVLELQIKYDAIRRALLQQKKIELQIERLDAKNDEIASINADIKRLDLEGMNRALLGAMREFGALYQIFQSFPCQYTRAELDAAQGEYWAKRLLRQAETERQATGVVGVGNRDALAQIGYSPQPQLEGHDDKVHQLPSIQP